MMFYPWCVCVLAVFHLQMSKRPTLRVRVSALLEPFCSQRHRSVSESAERGREFRSGQEPETVWCTSVREESEWGVCVFETLCDCFIQTGCESICESVCETLFEVKASALPEPLSLPLLCFSLTWPSLTQTHQTLKENRASANWLRLTLRFWHKQRVQNVCSISFLSPFGLH